MKKVNYGFIDIFKLFFAFGIVALHTGFLLDQPFGYYIHTNIFRLGVPFFFVVSGFLLASHDKIDKEKEKNKIKKFIIKNIKLYYILGILYIVIGIIRNGYNSNDMINQIWYLITFRSLSVIWFIGALICSAIVLLHIKDKKMLEKSIIIFLVLYFIGLAFNTYSFYTSNSHFKILYNFLINKFNNNSNFIFIGALYFLLGYYLKKYGKYNNNNNNIQFLLLLFGVLITVFETIIVKKNLSWSTNYEYFIGHIFTVPALMLILANMNLKFDTTIIRNLSKNIYYYHFMIIIILLKINKNNDIYILNNNIVFYLITCFITIIISIIIDLVLKRIGGKK